MLKSAKAHFYLYVSRLPTGPLLIFIQGFSLLMWWVVGSYLGIDTYRARSFSSADGHCDPSSEGLGVHCWGDYYYPVFLSQLENPFDGLHQSAYPAAALIPFQFFSWLSEISGIPSLGLALFLTAIMGSIGWSVWVGTKGLIGGDRFVVFTALTLLAPPVIIALDRGNSVGFLVPLLIWLKISIENNRSLGTASSIALLAAIKPHFGLLVMLLFFLGRKKQLFLSLTGVIAINFLPYILFWLGGFPENIPQSLARVMSFQDWSSVSQMYPINLSFAHGLYNGSKLVGSLIPGVDVSLIAFIQSIDGSIGFVVLGFVVLLVFLWKERLTESQVFILLISAISLTSLTTYSYYALFAIPALIALSREKNTSKLLPADHEDRLTKRCGDWISFALWVASIFTMTQFPIFETNSQSSVFTTLSFVGLVWIMVYIIIFLILAFSESTNSKNLKSTRGS